MEEKKTVTLNQEQIIELKEIMMDGDEKAALEYLRENIYNVVMKGPDTACGPPF